MDITDRMFPGSEYPDLNHGANQAVTLELTTSSSSATDYQQVHLRVCDRASGEVLADVEIDAAQWWRLLQGGHQTWPAFVSPNLDRVGKKMENRRVTLPDAVVDETERDLARDIYRAVTEQLPADWPESYEHADAPRRDNTATRFTTVRRWVTP